MRSLRARNPIAPGDGRHRSKSFCTQVPFRVPFSGWRRRENASSPSTPGNALPGRGSSVASQAILLRLAPGRRPPRPILIPPTGRTNPATTVVSWVTKPSIAQTSSRQASLSQRQRQNRVARVNSTCASRQRHLDPQTLLRLWSVGSQSGQVSLSQRQNRGARVNSAASRPVTYSPVPNRKTTKQRQLCSCTLCTLMFGGRPSRQPWSQPSLDRTRPSGCDSVAPLDLGG